MSKTTSSTAFPDLPQPGPSLPGLSRLGLSRRNLLQAGGVVLLLGRQHIAQGATIVGRDGFIWLEDPPLPGELVVKTGEGECRVTLPAPRTASSIQNIGEQLCH